MSCYILSRPLLLFLLLISSKGGAIGGCFDEAEALVDNKEHAAAFELLLQCLDQRVRDPDDKPGPEVSRLASHLRIISRHVPGAKDTLRERLDRYCTLAGESTGATVSKYLVEAIAVISTRMGFDAIDIALQHFRNFRSDARHRRMLMPYVFEKLWADGEAEEIVSTSFPEDTIAHQEWVFQEIEKRYVSGEAGYRYIENTRARLTEQLAIKYASLVHLKRIEEAKELLIAAAAVAKIEDVRARSDALSIHGK